MNPLHTDDVHVEAKPFERRFVPGLLTASLFTQVRGLRAFLAQGIHFEILATVCIMEAFRAEAEVVDWW